MRRRLVPSLVGAPLFLFFINSVVGNSDFYPSFLYAGAVLLVGYCILNISAILCNEIPMKNVVVDVVFLYILSLLGIIIARIVKWPHSLVAMAIVIWVMLTALGRIAKRLG